MGGLNIEVLFVLALALLALSYLRSPGAGILAVVGAYAFYSIEKDEVSALIAIGAVYIMAITAVAPVNALSHILAYSYIPLAVALPTIYCLVAKEIGRERDVQPQGD